MGKNIAIIGAGITGVTTAYALLARGFEVSVFERDPHAALGTSYANGGQLSASNAEAWNKWGTIIKGVSWLARQEAPLLFNLTPTWHKYSWIAEFLWATRHYKDNTQETVRMALQARQRLNDIAERENISFDHEKRGILHFYKDPKRYRAAHQVNRLLTDAGLERYPVTAAEMTAIEPAIAGPVEGGFYTPGDQTGDIHKFTRRLADRCAQKGARFHYNTLVYKITPQGHDICIDWQHTQANPDELDSTHTDGQTSELFNGLVICAGCASRKLAHLAGDRVNIYPVKGYSITVTLPDNIPRSAAPWVSLLDDSKKIVASRLGAARYRVAGTAEVNGFNCDIHEGHIASLVKWIKQMHPKLDPVQITPWAGLRPMMPDMMPAVRQGRHPSVFYNTGHGHLGWTLSAGTSEMVASLIESTTRAHLKPSPRPKRPAL